MALDVDLSGMTSSQLDNLKVEREKELLEAIKAKGVIEERKFRIERIILKLEAKKHDLMAVLRKARQTERELTSEIRILESAFWNARHSGS